MKHPNIAIIGAGWAGLTAAVTLSDNGLPTTTFEASRTLGGRARKIKVNNKTLDNGIHLMSGAYSETLALLNKIRSLTEPLNISRQPFSYQYEKLKIKMPRSKIPFGRLIGFLSAQGINVKEKLLVLNFLRAIKFNTDSVAATESAHSLLLRYKQTTNLINLFWNPICLSALNVETNRGSANVFVNVIADALLGGKDTSDLLFPTTDLTSLFASRSARYIEAHKGTINCGLRATIRRDKHELFSIEGSQDLFSHVVLATSPHNVKNVVTDPSFLPITLPLINQMEYEPIYTIYHQYTSDVSLPNRMIGLDSPYPQWVFDRGVTHHDLGLIGAVISGTGKHQELTNQQLSEESARTLDARFKLGQPIWSKVIAEKRATYSCMPNLKRPKQVTETPGIILAGDYTYPRYPATLEAAVRSGVRAAKITLESI